jgi:hypothetical protein
MTDLRTYQTLAYLTNRPDLAKEVLGVEKAASSRGGWADSLLTGLGRSLTWLGNWLLNRAEGRADAQARAAYPTGEASTGQTA